jgi:CheY-like chemotaxis protein
MSTLIQTGEPASVLVADDVAFFRRYLGEVLRNARFEVFEASSGVEAMRQLQSRERRPNLLLMDVDLPEQGAVGLLPLIRAKHTRDELAVLLLTKTPEFAEMPQFRDLGADGHVNKHGAAEHVIFSVSQAIARREKERRGSPRYLVDSPICWNGGEYKGVGRLVDIGAGGLHVQCMGTPPPLGSLLKLSFVFPGREEEVVAEGRVVRSAPLRFSAAFRSLDDSARAALLSFLESATG